MSELSIVIPAAGVGRTRKKTVPHALIPVEGGTLLDQQIKVLRKSFPGAEIIAVLGCEAEAVQKALGEGIRIVENENYDTTSAARSIAMGLRATDSSRAIIVYGDVMFTQETLKPLYRPDWGLSAVLLDDNKAMPADEIGVILDEHRMVTHFDYGLPHTWTGIASLTGRELSLFRQLGNRQDRRRYLGWELFNEIIDKGGRFAGVGSRGVSPARVRSRK